MIGLQSQPAAEATWLDVGVDDLTKYRIVEYLYTHLGFVAEVPSLAAALGFHSLDQTQRALEELARWGVVWLAAPLDGAARCGPSADPALCARIAELLALYQTPDQAAELLERLALRSLARARARMQNHNGHSADRSISGLKPRSRDAE